MVEAFVGLGHVIELLAPPGVHAESIDSPHRVPAKKPVVARFVGLVASRVPEIAFECFELAYNLLEVPRLLSRVSSFSPDVIYVRYSLFTFAPALVCKWRNIPMVLEVNDATFIKRSRPLVLKAIAAKIESWIFRKASLWVTISRHFAELAYAYQKVDPGKVLVVSNAVSEQRFVPGPKTSDQKRLVIGVVGAFVAWHGLDLLIQAILILRAKHYEFDVLLVGDGPTRRAIEEMVHRKALKDIVTFTGFVPSRRVPEFLRNMDICLIPDSNTHGSPMKLFEYMAMAKPTVAPRYGPIEEVLEHGSSGLLFNPGDVADFCGQIEKLMLDPVLREFIGQRARKAVLSAHTWSANARLIVHRLQDGIIS